MEYLSDFSVHNYIYPRKYGRKKKKKPQVSQRVCEDFLPVHVLNMFHKLS